MQRYLTLAVVLLAAGAIWIGIRQRSPHSLAPRAQAQSGTTASILNDTTPGLDAVINTAPGTSGVVSVRVAQASITVSDSAGNVVFQTSDPRVHTVELRFTPNAGTHTLAVKRLPGVKEAYVQVTSQTALTDLGASTPVSTNIVALQQQYDLPLTANAPNTAVAISIPAGTSGAVVATFPGAPVTAQMMDNSGTAVASLYAGQIDGLSVSLDGGSYVMTLLDTNPAQNTVATISVMPDRVPDFAAPAPADMVPASGALASNAPAEVCTVTVATRSINLYSGPGPGYSVLNDGLRGDQYLVGGTNTDGSWLLVGAGDRSGWMAGNTGQVSGICSNLAVYDIPYQDAPAPQVFLQPPGAGRGDFGEHEGGEFGDD